MSTLTAVIFVIWMIQFENGCIANVSFPSSIKIGHLYCEVSPEHAAIAFNESIKKLKSDQVVSSATNFEILYTKTCDDASSLNASATMIREDRVDVIFGPENTEGMTVAALLASLKDVPIVGYGSIGDVLSNKTKYSTLIRTSFGMRSMGKAVSKLLAKFNWLNVALIHSNKTECEVGVSGVYNELKAPNTSNIKSDYTTVSEAEIDMALNTIKTVARIIILCYGYEPNSANDFLKKAKAKGMVNDEYLYIIPYYLRTKILDDEHGDTSPWDPNGKMNETEYKEMQAIYKHVIVIQATGDNSDKLSQFKTLVEQQALETVNTTRNYKLFGKEPVYLPLLHDSLYMYVKAINITIMHGNDYRRGVGIFQSAKHMQFEGKTGIVTMDSSADRYGDYDVLAMTKDNKYTTMLTMSATSNSSINDIVVQVTNEPQQPDLFYRLPPDTPQPCGFTDCQDTPWGSIGIGLGFLGAVILVIAIYTVYRKQKLEKDIFKMTWKLQLSDVKFMASRSSNSNSLRSVGMASMKGTIDSGDSGSTMDTLPDGDFKAMASVRGTPAYAKCWQKKKQAVISLDRHQLLLLKQMKEVQHDNVNAFLGAILDEGTMMMVFWKHCAKGSLHDLVMNEDIQLDQMFTVAILHDVISGLDYLHNKSSLHYHGNLSVTNCLVDSRWVVKLSDFGWTQLHEVLADQGHLQPKMVNVHRLYHIAPELLRRMHDDKPMELTKLTLAMQDADVYSLSMIIYHVLFRTEPYSDEPLEPSTIIERIQTGGSRPMRPVIPKHNGMSNLIAIMQSCWVEGPLQRPSVMEIKRSMYNAYGKTLKRSLIDHVMSLLEKYATNLEKIVEERTQQLELERKRADQLLYQMLPRSVADMLKSGQAIEPETYDWVTIYFSDIVGFTRLSSQSTPMQIVSMLNSLYSAFDESIRMYDVYKVETIGDAYMVVSGCPKRNGVRHVFEICDMALSILQVVFSFQIAHRPGEQLKIRIGIHSGSAAAGVVGLTMPRYCLFGDTVNTASRMESNGLPCKIHISQQTRDLLVPNPEYMIQTRGQVELKGKGLCTTYWLLEKRKAQSSGMYQGRYKATDQK